jgi:hypothetical protein
MERTPTIGDVVDIRIPKNELVTYIVGTVTGVRQDYFNVDQVAILISGIDLWITLDETMEVDFIEQ